jgi:hypothetical protein
MSVTSPSLAAGSLFLALFNEYKNHPIRSRIHEQLLRLDELPSVLKVQAYS